MRIVAAWTDHIVRCEKCKFALYNLFCSITVVMYSDNCLHQGVPMGLLSVCHENSIHTDKAVALH